MEHFLQPDCELEDDLFITGHPGFDEITRLLDREAEMQAHMDTAGAKYDEQFIEIKQLVDTL